MPFGGALFWGQAAQSTDASMREWERLWQVEQQRLSQEKMQEDQQRFQLDVELRRQRFEERMAEAERNFSEGLVDRNEQFQLGQEALDRMGDMSLDQQWATVEWLERSGNPVSSLARQTVRSGLFQNPQEAISLIDSVFTSPLGTKFNPTFVNMGLDVVIGMTGMSEDEADEFRANVQSVLDQRAGEAEELDLAGMEGTRLALQQARADIVQTGAQTGNILANTQEITARTAQVYQNMDITEEQRTLHLNILQRTVDDMDATIRIKGLEATAQDIMNGFLPSQLNADLHRTWAETQEVENRNDLYTRTVDYVVDEMAARTGLAQEDLRFALATSATREAIVNGDLEFLMANIDMLRTQEENVRADTALTGTQQQVLEVGMDEARLRMNESRIRMLSELTASGDVSLLEAGGAQLLRDMGFDDVTAARVLEDLSGVATSNRSHALQLEEANVILALEEAEYARATTQDRIATTAAQRGLTEFELATAPQRLEFERWATEEGFRIDWAHVDIARESLQVQREGIAAQNARAAVSGTPVTPGSMLNDTRIATGIDLKEFNTLQTNMEQATNDLNYFRGLMANGNVQEISDYLTSIGVSPENHAEHLASLEAQQQSATRAYAGAISSYISLGVAEYGTVFTPQQLGITTELGLEAYREVLPYAAPGVVPVTEEEQNAVDEGQAARIAEVRDSVYRMSSTLAREAGENGLSTIVGANEMYQRLMAEFGPERLQEAGIFNPEQLGNDLGNQVVDYQRNVEAAMDGLNFVTGNNPQQIDARDPQALNSAATTVNAAAGQLTAFRQTLDAIPTGAQTGGLSFLGIGASNSPERGQAARQLVAMTSGFISPWELASRGIIQLDGDGNVTDFLHVAGAKRLVDEISARMYQSAGAIRWLAANGGIR